MKLEKGVVSNTQLIFLIMSFMQSMIMTVGFNYPLTKQDTWIAALAAFAITLLMALVYTSIAKKFAGLNLVQINDEVFGVYFGKVITALYIWFFFQLIIHYLYFFNSFWITYIMPETPRFAFLAMAVFICAFSIRSGIEVVSRCYVLLYAAVLVMVIGVTLLLIKDANPSNLLPILQSTPKDFIQSTHIFLTIAFCDIVVFLMIFPYTADNQNLKKPVLIAVCFSALFLLMVIFREILVGGARIYSSNTPNFALSREIDIAVILTRLDILVALNLFITVIMKITIFFYATSLSIAQTLKLKSYQPLLIPLGALCVTIAINLYPSDMEQFYAGQFIWPFNAGLMEFVIPIITLIVIAIRKLPKKGELSK